MIVIGQLLVFFMNVIINVVYGGLQLIIKVNNNLDSFGIIKGIYLWDQILVFQVLKGGLLEGDQYCVFVENFVIQFGNGVVWWWMLVLCLILVIVLWIGICFMFELVCWYLVKGWVVDVVGVFK